MTKIIKRCISSLKPEEVYKRERGITESEGKRETFCTKERVYTNPNNAMLYIYIERERERERERE